jgi:protein disulfide-isomerase
MLNKFTFIFCSLICIFSSLTQAQTPGARATIQWQTNYEQAVQQSKATNKPLILFFTGSDWCGWCNKLDEEALETIEFADTIANKFIFVKLDFPLYSNQDPQAKAQNKELQQRFDVRSFPTIVVVDPKQNQQIGVTGYRPGGGKLFAEHLLKMVNDYSGYKQKISALDNSNFSGQELKPLYKKAKELSLVSDANKIVKKGMASEEAIFFMLERYHYLADEGQINSKEATALKQVLQQADPQNEKQVHYLLAVIDFETYAGERGKENYNSELTVSPLTTYIEKFRSKDKENIWRLQLLISQVYLDQNEMTSALKYAQQSYECAPSCAQPELLMVVQNIRSKILTGS